MDFAVKSDQISSKCCCLRLRVYIKEFNFRGFPLPHHQPMKGGYIHNMQFRENIKYLFTLGVSNKKFLDRSSKNFLPQMFVAILKKNIFHVLAILGI